MTRHPCPCFCATTHNNLGNLRSIEARKLDVSDPMAAMQARQEAIALHTRATQLDPRYAIAAYNLGHSHAELAELLAETGLSEIEVTDEGGLKAFAKAD